MTGAGTGTVTTRAAGSFIEIGHPAGTVTLMGIGQGGHITMPGQGLVRDEIGITKIEVDASGNVTEVQHGIFSPGHMASGGRGASVVQTPLPLSPSWVI